MADTAQSPSESAAAGTDAAVDRDDAPPLVRCRSVGREYAPSGSGWFRRRERGEPVRALRDVSLTIDRGEFVGLTGPSGSGKSTLLHLLAALDTPTSGTVEFDGRDLAALSGRERARFRLDRVGIVFQRFHLLPSLSARGNVALPLLERGVGKRTRRERATELLEAVGLGDRVGHRPGELSGGEQQRVAIARALVTGPDIVVADEPTGELDSRTSQQILELLADFAADHTVVLASHDPAAIAVADRRCRLRDGRLVDDA